MLPSLVLLISLVLFLLCSSRVLCDLNLVVDTGGGSPSKEAIHNLVGVTLANENVFFLIDPEVVNYLDLDQLFQTAAESLRSYIFMTWDELGNTDQLIPDRFIRGQFMTILVIFINSPLPFLDQEEKSATWNPDHLILMTLDRNTNVTQVFGHKTVQRSECINFIERQDKEFAVSKVLHKTPGKDETTKMVLGFYDRKKFSCKKELCPIGPNNLAGGVLALASWCEDKPFIHLYTGKTECEGISLDLLSIMTDEFHFKYDVQLETADGSWGSKVNGTWSGMMADLIYNGKHLVINYFLLTSDLYSDFDTTYPYFSEGFGFVIRNPRPPPPWHGLINPFTSFVWASSICTTALVGVMLTVALYFVKDSQPYDTAFLLVLACILRQGYPERLTGSWVRLWMMIWWLGGFVISLAYTSNLVAFLTIPQNPKRIETVDELASSNLRVLMNDYGDFLPHALKISEDKSLKHLGDVMDMFPIFNNSFAILAFPKVLAGTHALVDTYSYLYLVRYAANMQSRTYFVKQIVYPGYLTWVLPKNTPYTAVISDTMQRLVESGIISKLYKKHMARPNIVTETSGWDVLKLEHLEGPFLLTAFGLIFSILCFVAELLLSHLASRKHLSVMMGQ